MKLATKDTKYDFKAQLGVAKEFTQRAKNLMRDMRRALADSANAVDAAVANSRAEMDAASNAAEEARRERDDASRALDAARAEAQASAAHLAAAAKREPRRPRRPIAPLQISPPRAKRRPSRTEPSRR